MSKDQNKPDFSVSASLEMEQAYRRKIAIVRTIWVILSAPLCFILLWSTMFEGMDGHGGFAMVLLVIPAAIGAMGSVFLVSTIISIWYYSSWHILAHILVTLLALALGIISLPIFPFNFLIVPLMSYLIDIKISGKLRGQEKTENKPVDPFDDSIWEE